MIRFLLAFLLTGAAAGAEESYPPTIREMLDNAANICGGPLTIAPHGVRHVDLDGDGVLDWLVDEGGVGCSVRADLCGTAGCGLHTVIDGRVGLVILFPDWELVELDGRPLLRDPDFPENTGFLWDRASGTWMSHGL